MTAAAPDPRFRDQLAGAAYMPLRRAFCERGIAAPDIAALDSDVSFVAGRLSDALMPTIAAEVEARAQAAANQRAAEELRAAADVIDLGSSFLDDTTPAQVNRNRANFLAAALEAGAGA